MNKIIYVCSSPGDKENLEDIKKYCRFVYGNGYTPYEFHLFFMQFMGDSERERSDALGMGLMMLRCASELWVFMDNGITEEMAREIEAAGREDMPVRYFRDLQEVRFEYDEY